MSLLGKLPSPNSSYYCHHLYYCAADATLILYGVLSQGTSQIWFNDIVLEVVSNAVLETRPNKGRDCKVLSFDKRAKAIANQI